MMNMGKSGKAKIPHNMKGDGLDDLIMALNWALGYSDQTVDYPEVDGVKPVSDIRPEWFYSAINGTPNFSELNAIRLYRSDTNKFDDTATTFSGISLVEMQHLDHLQEFVLAIGGNLADSQVGYSTEVLDEDTRNSKDNKSALNVAISGEQDTIAHYKTLLTKCNNAKDSMAKTVAIQLLNKLIADETYHIKLFKEELNKLNKSSIDKFKSALKK